MSSIHSKQNREIKARSPKERWDNYLKRLESWRKAFLRALDAPVYHYLFFTIFILFLIFILGDGLTSKLKQPTRLTTGEIAPYDVKATHDFTVSTENLAQTTALQNQAAAQVLPVYDWHTEISDELQLKTVLAFSTAREKLAENLVDVKSFPPSGHSPRGKKNNSEEDGAFLTPHTITSAQILQVIKQANPTQRLHAAENLETAVFEKSLSRKIPTRLFNLLASSGFRPEIERAITETLAYTLDRAVITQTGMSNVAARHGLYLRRFRADSLLVSYRIHSFGNQVVFLDKTEPLITDFLDEQSNFNLDEQERAAVISVVKILTVPNTFFSPEATTARQEQARNAVQPVINTTHFQTGQIIIQQGHVVTEQIVRTIQAMTRMESPANDVQIVIGLALLIIVLIGSIFGYGLWNIKAFKTGKRDIVLMASLLLILAAFARALVSFSSIISETSMIMPEASWYWLIPAAGGAMTVRLMLTTESAVLFSIAIAGVVGIICGDSLFVTFYVLVGCFVGAGSVFHVRNRIMIMASGAAVGLINALMILSYNLLRAEILDSHIFTQVMLGFGSGLLSGFLVLSFLPLIEWGFGYTTDIKLLELANLDHPALRELFVKASGSYHHSLMVGTLAEAAAEAIGCNALLARVGSYYHDIGKSKNPEYFTENQHGRNPHDDLKPAMSAKVIRAHVTEGEKMAREYRLPEVIIDFIKEHHGTKLIGHFFFKAKTEEDPDKPEVVEKDYRYPGPKPQTKETAICMLADGSEAGTRALKVKTEASIRERVKSIFDDAWKTGQLDQSALTRKDLSTVYEVMVKLLMNIHHQRVEYLTNKKDGDKNKRGRRISERNKSASSSR